MTTVDEQASRDHLALGRDALARAAWEEARVHLSAAADDDVASVEALELLGWAGWWLADEATTFDARERAFGLARDRGDERAAGRIATWLAADFREFRGDAATGRGWLARAHRFLDDLPETEDHGWLALTDADFALNEGDDLDVVTARARDAALIGRRMDAPDVESVGLALDGLAAVARGDVPAGLRLLEEAAAVATGRDLRLPLAAGWALCCGLAACDGIGDLGRASGWCAAMRDFVERWGGRQLLGVCRTSYGRILALRGEWTEAEAELVAAVDAIESARPGMAASGHVRLAELRARQGRTDEARELFTRAGPAGLVGLGELALAEGDASTASALAERVLRRVPRSSMLGRLAALELRARAAIAAGELDAAAEATRAVNEIGVAFGTLYVAARSRLLDAELAAARGDHDASRCAAEDAVDAFVEAAAPYDAALARLHLATALRALGRDDAADHEEAQARGMLTRLGVHPALPSGAGARHADLTERELEVLRLVAAGHGDAEIAQRLVVSPHTVHRHVANIRAKLRLPSRAAAVAHATRHGLI